MFSKRCGRTHGACAWSTFCATYSWPSWSSPTLPLHDVLRIFSDNEFRKGIAKSLRNETVRTFLLKEFERFSFGYRADGTAPIQNKVGAFLADPLLNRILTAPEKDLHIRRIMDQGQVLLVNLAKGHIGEDSSSLLGGLLVTTIGLGRVTAEPTPPQPAPRLLRICR